MSSNNMDTEMTEKSKKEEGDEETGDAAAHINNAPDSKEGEKAVTGKRKIANYLKENYKKNFDKNSQVDEAMEKKTYAMNFTSTDLEDLTDMIKMCEVYLKEVEKELKTCKEEEKRELESKRDQLKEFDERIKAKEKEIVDDINRTGNNPDVLATISEYNQKEYKSDQPELDFLIPRLYKLDVPPLGTEGGERMIQRYTLCWIASFILNCIAISEDYTVELFKTITVLMFVANMISTTFTILSLYYANVRLSGFNYYNGHITIFSSVLSIILTVVLLLPWSFILGERSGSNFDKTTSKIIGMASCGMIILYFVVSYVLINSMVKMSKVLSTHIHDNRQVIVANYYEYEENGPQKRDLHVLYDKNREKVKAAFLQQLNKIKSFRKFIKYALVWSLPELFVSVILTTYLVFHVKKLSTLTLLYINCSVYPFTLLLISAILFNNKIKAFEAENELDTGLLIDFLGVEITQSWLVALSSPLYTFLIKLYGMDKS